MMVSKLERFAKVFSWIGGIISAFATIFGLFALVLNWEAIYSFFKIQHTHHALRVGYCTKTYPIVPNAYPFNVRFSDNDCDSTVKAMDIHSGILTKSYICGGIDNFDVHYNPKGVTFYGRHLQNCGSHPSEVTVAYLGTQRN